MNHQELLDRYQRHTQAISVEEGLAAAAIIIKRTHDEGIGWALAGDLALCLYGYLSGLQTVTMLASQKPAGVAIRQLAFGGTSYEVDGARRKIRVDVIVRDDFFREFYAAALRDAQTTPDGWRVIMPEWMVILKYLAGRGKDQLDLLWLLREPGLVDRAEVAHLLEEVAGQTSAQIALRGLEPFYVQAEVMRAGDENGAPE